MPFRSELDKLDPATLIEAFTTFVSAAGLPAYMGWHGDSFIDFGLYSVAAGLGLTAGMMVLHPPPRLGAAGLTLTWLLQTVAIAVFGGIVFQLAGQLR